VNYPLKGLSPKNVYFVTFTYSNVSNLTKGDILRNVSMFFVHAMIVNGHTESYTGLKQHEGE